MTEFKEHTPGTFSWVDLGTTDAEGAKKFYGDLFGWSMIDVPAGPDMVYTMCQKEGKEVAGMYQMGQEMQDQGIPPFWNSYISVANADETAAKSKLLGGAVIQEPLDVFDSGRMAMLKDPEGAVFALWQPKEHIGAKLANEPGTFCWNELVVNNPDKTGKFYTNLFGWSRRADDMGNFMYHTFINGERMNGGMMQIRPEWGEVPPNWSVYFAVEDCDDAVKKIEALGGKIVGPPMDIPNVGRFAMIQDPQGAYFYVIRMSSPE